MPKKRTLKNRTIGKTTWAIPVLAALAAAACGDAPDAGPPPAGVIELSEQFTGDFDLIDHNGRPVTDEDFKGKLVAVYFGFATCPDVCPMALGSLSAALNELNEEELAQIAPVFITVDPARDTPEALKTFLAFDDRLIGLSGPVEKVEAAQQAFKVYARKQPLPETSELDYLMDHSSLFYVVDRDGQPRVALQDTLTPQEIAAALRRGLAWR